MIWTIFKGSCRLYSGVCAMALLFAFLGQALTGGVRITPDAGHMMAPVEAAGMFLWLVAVVVTAVASFEEA